MSQLSGLPTTNQGVGYCDDTLIPLTAILARVLSSSDVNAEEDKSWHRYRDAVSVSTE